MNWERQWEGRVWYSECAYGVVEDEHDRRGVPCPSLAPEEHLANVADVAYFGVTKTELPEDKGGVEDGAGDEDGQDQTKRCQGGFWGVRGGMSYPGTRPSTLYAQGKLMMACR